MNRRNFMAGLVPALSVVGLSAIVKKPKVISNRSCGQYELEVNTSNTLVTINTNEVAAIIKLPSHGVYSIQKW